VPILGLSNIAIIIWWLLRDHHKLGMLRHAKLDNLKEQHKNMCVHGVAVAAAVVACGV
jgi:hypothetical protein